MSRGRRQVLPGFGPANTETQKNQTTQTMDSIPGLVQILAPPNHLCGGGDDEYSKMVEEYNDALVKYSETMHRYTHPYVILDRQTKIKQEILENHDTPKGKEPKNDENPIKISRLLVIIVLSLISPILIIADRKYFEASILITCINLLLLLISFAGNKNYSNSTKARFYLAVNKKKISDTIASFDNKMHYNIVINLPETNTNICPKLEITDQEWSIVAGDAQNISVDQAVQIFLHKTEITVNNNCFQVTQRSILNCVFILVPNFTTKKTGIYLCFVLRKNGQDKCFAKEVDKLTYTNTVRDVPLEISSVDETEDYENHVCEVMNTIKNIYMAGTDPIDSYIYRDLNESRHVGGIRLSHLIDNKYDANSILEQILLDDDRTVTRTCIYYAKVTVMLILFTAVVTITSFIPAFAYRYAQDDD